MAKFIATETFMDIRDSKVYQKGTPFDMSIARADEIKQNILLAHGVEVDFKRLDVKDDVEKDVEEANEETDGD